KRTRRVAKNSVTDLRVNIVSLSLFVSLSRFLRQRRSQFGDSAARSQSERRRRVHPQQPGFTRPRVLPAMRRGAFEVETVAAFQMVLFVGEGDLQFSAQDEQELLAFVGIRFTAAGARLDAEQVRFHDGVAPGK